MASSPYIPTTEVPAIIPPVPNKWPMSSAPLPAGVTTLYKNTVNITPSWIGYPSVPVGATALSQRNTVITAT